MPRRLEYDAVINPPLDCLPNNKENFQLIWLDASIDQSDDTKLTKEIFRVINNNSQFYTNIDKCVELILSIAKEHIILVVSGTYGHECMSRIYNVRAVRAVFIFCEIRESHTSLIAQYPSKIIDIFTDRSSLVKSIIKTMKCVDKQDLSFHMFDQKQKSMRDLSVESASFLSYQLLLDVLRKLPSDERSKLDMIQRCNAYYHNNKHELKKIKRFRSNFTPDQSIKYYTEDSFLYRLLNKALRTEDIELLYTFRFFIIALCDQLEKEQKRMKSSDAVVVYRGQCMTKDEFQKLKAKIGNLIAINGFLSTSRNIETALMFTPPFNEKEEIVGVLLEIKADPKLKAVVFADISQQSEIKDEEEVLFSLGSIFKIDTCFFDERLQVWKIQLDASDDGFQLKLDYLKFQEKQLHVYSPLIYFGRLLINEMHQLDPAKKYFKKLLNTLPITDPDLPEIFFHIGFIHKLKAAKFKATSYKNDYKQETHQALKMFEKALTFWRGILPECDIRIANALVNIGLVYGDLEDHTRAVEYYQRAISLFETVELADRIRKAVLFENCGKMKGRTGDYLAAISFYTRAHEIYCEDLPVHHQLRRNCLASIGYNYTQMNKFSEALSNYQLAFYSYDEMLSPADTDYFNAWQNVIHCYVKLDDKRSILDYLDRVLVKCKSIFHDDFTTGNEFARKMVKLFEHFSDFDMAFECYKRITFQGDENILINFSSLQEPYLLFSYHMSREQHLKLLSFHLEVYRNLCSHINTVECAKFLNKIGEKYLNYECLTVALHLFQEAFDILEISNLSDRDLFIQCCCNVIKTCISGNNEESASHYMKRAMQKCKKDHDICVQLLWRTGQLYENLGDRESAHPLYVDAFNEFQALMSTEPFVESSYYALRCVSLSLTCSYLYYNDDKSVLNHIQKVLTLVPNAEIVAYNIDQLIQYYEKKNAYDKLFSTYEYLLSNEQSNDSVQQVKIDQSWIIFIESTCQNVSIKTMNVLQRIMNTCLLYLPSSHHKIVDLYLRMAQAYESEASSEHAINCYKKAELISGDIIRKCKNGRALAALQFYYGRCNRSMHIERMFLKVAEKYIWPLILCRCILLKMIFAENHLEYERNLYNLVESTTFTRMAPPVIRSIEEALQVVEERNTLKDYIVLHHYEFLGALYYKEGQYQKSLFYRQCQLDVESTLSGRSNRAYGWCVRSIGLIFQRMGEYDTSLKHLDQSLDILKQSLSEKHFEIQEVLQDILLTKQLLLKKQPSLFIKTYLKSSQVTDSEKNRACVTDSLSPRILQATIHLD